MTPAELRAMLTRRWPDVTITTNGGTTRALALAEDGTCIAITTGTGPSKILDILDQLTSDD